MSRIDEHRGWLKGECMRLKTGRCSTYNCLVRGGYVRGENEGRVDHGIATCEAYEIDRTLRTAFRVREALRALLRAFDYAEGWKFAPNRTKAIEEAHAAVDAADTSEPTEDDITIAKLRRAADMAGSSRNRWKAKAERLLEALREAREFMRGGGCNASLRRTVDTAIEAAETFNIHDYKVAPREEPPCCEAARLIARPEIRDYREGVVLEAAHQRQRWGRKHDDLKEPEDWFWLLGYLAGKALAAHRAGDLEKARHHTISSGAALAHWHQAITEEAS